MAVSPKYIRAAINGLLEARQPPATICPSEVARALAPEHWRPLMPQVRAVALAMAAKGEVVIRQGGHAIAPEDPLRGPIRLGHGALSRAGHRSTPDGRYFVVRGRLWRKANPNLPAATRDALVKELMEARRMLRGRRSDIERAAARAQVDRVKRALGERGPAWWHDGAPDYNRRMAKNTPYADWYASLPE
jgi:hypothetical protein